MINGATNSVTSTITGLSTPFAVAVNSITNTIYVANQGNGTVSVISGSSNSIHRLRYGRQPAIGHRGEPTH